jgi:hypothetical protein
MSYLTGNILLLLYRVQPVTSLKIWSFHGSDYEEFPLLGYENPVRTSQKTYQSSATDPRQLILCKIWDFRGGDYEECRTSQETPYFSSTESSRLLLFRFEVFAAVTMKNSVFWDMKTQFVLHRRHISPPLQTLSQLMLCKIWSLHGGDYEESRLMGYKNPVRTSKEAYQFSATEPSWLLLCEIWSFRRNVSPPSSEWKESTR